jgi:hypothetical protein
MSQENLGWNPARVLFGLSRIGYKPHTALADIMDNSISYGATEVNLVIKKEREDLADTRKNNIEEYIVIDNGDGMNREGILSALALGAGDEAQYDEGSLSKFGLGLKSASFSQGNLLEIVSSAGDEFKKFAVDLETITDNYFCVELALDALDQELINGYLDDGKGTIIRIKKIHKNNHPSVKKTVDELKYRLGIIYYYFISEGITLKLNGDVIEGYDVLFTEEAEQNGALNEHEWDGRQVQWIKKPVSQTLDISGERPVKAIVEVTQLPHPPTFDLDGEGERAKVRDHYKIDSGNYGYYVYRNKRLISWAERFSGIIPQDQDFYAFRGRILLDNSADDAFNIDVKKSHLELSNEAWDSLSDLSDEYKRKSKKAWQRATALKKQMMGEDTSTVSNEIANDLNLPDEFLGGKLPTPEEEKTAEVNEENLKEKIKRKLRHDATEFKRSSTGAEEVTDEEIQDYATGGSSSDKRIFRVDHIEDNLLWEPYYDDDHGWCVRINKNHRFSRLIFEDNNQNTDMAVIYDLLLLHFAHAEVQIKRSPHYDSDSASEIITAFRESVSNLLVALVRNRAVGLPPL